MHLTWLLPAHAIEFSAPAVAKLFVDVVFKNTDPESSAGLPSTRRTYQLAAHRLLITEGRGTLTWRYFSFVTAWFAFACARLPAAVAAMALNWAFVSGLASAYPEKDLTG